MSHKPHKQIGPTLVTRAEPANRLSPRVFIGRIARVEVGDTSGDAPYSVVRKILSWETGAPRRVTQSASHTSRKAPGSDAC